MKTLTLLISFVLFYCNATAQCGIITTLAGIDTSGYSGDGFAATLAKLEYPNGVAADNHGNVYVSVGNRIRKINSSGTITTVAGNGTYGYSGDGVAATSTMLYAPGGLTVDTIGNIYFADKLNYRIRKINRSGIISTVAGDGSAGFGGDGYAATNAQLYDPNSVEIDRLGNLYIADLGNRRIRKVDTAGIITTIAGNGTAGFGGDAGAATNAQLSGPTDMAIDNTGNLYIADQYSSQIRIVNTSGIITRFAGINTRGYGGDGGQATAAELNGPSAVAVDTNGNVYITEILNDRVRMVDRSGIISSISGTGVEGFSGDGGPASVAKLFNPTEIATDQYCNLFIADKNNYRVRRISALGTPPVVLSITGATALCVDSTISLSCGTAGGSWSSVFPAIATVNSIGNVTGVSTGIDTIHYSLSNRCGTTKSSKVLDVSVCPDGVEQITSEHSIKVAPNPFTDKITVSSKSKIQSVLITNVIGQVVRRIEPKVNEIEIDLGNLEKGLYFVNVDNVQHISILKK